MTGKIDEILSNISKDIWEYYLDKVLIKDDIILYKLMSNFKILERWIEIIKIYELAEEYSNNKSIRDLLNVSNTNKLRDIKRIAKELYKDL